MQKRLEAIKKSLDVVKTDFNNNYTKDFKKDFDLLTDIRNKIDCIYNKHKRQRDVREIIKKLDSNITNVVSRKDGTLEINVKKQSEETKRKVLSYINQKSLNSCFTKIDFHEVGGVL